MSSALRCKHSNSKNFTCGGCSTQRNFMWRAIKIFGWVLSWWSVTSFAKQGTLPFECGTLSSLWSPTFLHLPLHLKGHQVIMYVWVDSVLAFQRDTDSESMNCFADGCQGDQSSAERNHLLVSDLNDQCGGLLSISTATATAAAAASLNSFSLHLQLQELSSLLIVRLLLQLLTNWVLQLNCYWAAEAITCFWVTKPGD